MPTVPGVTFDGTVEINSGINKINVIITGTTASSATLTNNNSAAADAGVTFVTAMWISPAAWQSHYLFDGTLAELNPPGGNLAGSEFLMTSSSANTFHATDRRRGSPSLCHLDDSQRHLCSPGCRRRDGLPNSAYSPDRYLRHWCRHINGHCDISLGAMEQYQFPSSIVFGGEVPEPDLPFSCFESAA